jgi:hypothetical protein
MIAARGPNLTEVVIAAAVTALIAIGFSPLPTLPNVKLPPAEPAMRVVHVELASPRQPHVVLPRPHTSPPPSLACLHDPLPPQVLRDYRAGRFAEAAGGLAACPVKAGRIRNVALNYAIATSRDGAANVELRWYAAHDAMTFDRTLGRSYQAQLLAAEQRIAPRYAQLWIDRGHPANARKFIQRAIDDGLATPALLALQRRLGQ